MISQSAVMQWVLRLVMGALLVAMLLFAAQIIVLTVYLRKGAYNVTPYAQENPMADRRILFLGDSTAVGTGADCHHHSVAGYFGKDYPQANITNISRNGLRLNELLQVWRPDAGDRYDLVIIQVGGNDILRFTPYEQIAIDLPQLLARAKSVADRVVILHSGNVGIAPVFIWPFNHIMTERTLRLRAIYQFQAKAYDAIYVDLFRNLADDPALKNTPFFYGPDALHPGAGGYYKWYEQIQYALKEQGVAL